MIISRAPYRISLFGGGSDYPEWFIDNGGKVLSMAIDKYCYISVSHPYHEIPFKVVWRHVELCEEARDILHPAVRGALEMAPITDGIEIHYHGELPARSGMGSSSSFAVALLNALYTYKDGHPPWDRIIFRDSIYLEREVLGETVGWQDQAAATYGGFHIYEFGPGEKMEIIDLHTENMLMSDLINNLFLVYTHLQRRSSLIAQDIVKDIGEKDVGKLVEMVDKAYYALVLHRLDDIGHLLHESWQIKKSLSPMISSASSGLDYIYDEAIKGGALGGKALGAGGGGFMVFYVPWKEREKFLATMQPISIIVPFSLSRKGAEIIQPKFGKEM